MTIAEMRQLLGLGSEVPEAAVVEAYAAYLAGAPAEAAPLPITLIEAKQHLRITPDDTTRDTEISGLISDAVRWVEKRSGHLLFARSVQQTFSRFGCLPLLAWPVGRTAQPVVTYGDQQEVVEGARLRFHNQTAYWTLEADAARLADVGDGGVTVTIRAGYESDEPIPGTFRRAALIMIAGFDEGGKALDAAERSAGALCDLEKPVIL